MSRSVYVPDSWELVRIVAADGDVVYKVLGGWSGSFTQGSSWKLSSGIKSVHIMEDRISMPQWSGSTYICYGEPRMSMLMHSVFTSLQSQVQEAGGSMELISLDTLMKELKCAQVT